MKYHYLQEGVKVQGVHRGTPYTGVVKSSRPSFVNDNLIHYVKLDSPIKYKLGDSAYGEADDLLLIRTNTEDDVSTIEPIE